MPKQRENTPKENRNIPSISGSLRRIWSLRDLGSGLHDPTHRLWDLRTSLSASLRLGVLICEVAIVMIALPASMNRGVGDTQMSQDPFE